MEATRSLAGLPSGEGLADGMRAFVRAIDRYGDYLRPEVLASLLATENGAYGGVGMKVYLDHDGRIVCIPLPDGPASRAGLVYGDVLVAAAGQDVGLLGIEDVAYLLRGEPGTPVELTVAGAGGGNRRQVTLTRAVVPPVTVTRCDTGSLPGVRISSFGRHTAEELAAILGRLDLSKGLVIDLRGNGGGDFAAGVKAASLFLDADAVVCVQRGRQGEKVYRSAGRTLHPRRIILWQDRLTASAAEVFLAALTENRQAVGIGQTSYGKGASQGMFRLARGGALVVTDALLLTPRGTRFDGIGLAPAHVLPVQPGGPDAGFREKTRDMAQDMP